ncbi:MAG: division/cell wall cluster transcriptional repressor MraZ [Lachnospiraceae bacterium]|nr:division/cell wall cluster transcriptional repressor MraZ [Lachnospiraceae bacterium]
MSKGLKGEYSHSIDTKGRMIVPSKLREPLGTSFVVTKGMDKCLMAYPNAEWDLFADQLNALPKIDRDAREMKRFFVGSAVDCEVDNQGRVLLPANLREFAGIVKDVMIVGQLDYVEIWSKERWEQRNGGEEVDIDELSGKIGQSGYKI